VAWEIVDYARREGFDLIVMGTHGRTGLKHVVMGSVAERVLRAAPCPVLVVKGKESAG
jgi:nucleotide-binding universal stress UspA family protein